jgi:hypothetical protein
MLKKWLTFCIFTMTLLSFLYPQAKEPIVYLEFTNFSDFLNELQRNENYSNFMGSSVMEWYKNTRLGLKFPKRIEGFEEILGFSISLENVETLAGKETGIWLFDIGELKILFITKISKADFLVSKLARERETFGEGMIDSVTYCYKKDASENKEVDFVFFKEHLILSNQPDEFEQFLRRLIKDSDFKNWKNSDFLDWYDEPLKENYDILLYLSPKSIRNTYFSSYWFYDNKEEIRGWFDRGIVTVRKMEKTVEETRIYKTVEGFEFDKQKVDKTNLLFSSVPENADMVSISPANTDRIEKITKRLLGGGNTADSLYLKIETMEPISFGNFVKIRRGEVLPEIEEGIAIVLEKPDKKFIEVFDSYYPANIRKHEIFSKNMPDLIMEDNLLLLSNTGNFFKNRKKISNGGFSLYGWLNLERLGESYRDEMKSLSNSNRWISYDDRDFFENNIGDLIGIATSYIKTVEKKGEIREGKITEKVIYTLR